METRHLIDGIVRQTTILIAQLSTTAGIRAPLSRVADQVFLNLARELEAQGVGRKVAADMFGLALRSYQLKISRLGESASESERTLWEAVLQKLRASPSGLSRRQLVESFRRDDPLDVAAVLKDLVDSGLASRAGRGEHAFYQVAGAEAVSAIAGEQSADAIANSVWLAVYDRQRVAREQLLNDLSFDPAIAGRAIDALIQEGRIERAQHEGSEVLVCRRLTIPVGSEQGWETAVFDHFRASATAIVAKLQRKGPRSSHGDVVGGSTLSFSIRPGHPFEEQVYGLLTRVRTDLNQLWEQVAAHNQANPLDPEERIEVTFYFGQNVIAPEGEGKAEP
jgi:hypothetical protein